MIAQFRAASAEDPCRDWPSEFVDELNRTGMNGRVGGQLVSETEILRVWHIRLAPGERLPFHRHVLDYFWTAVSPGRARSYYEGGLVREFTYEVGDTAHFTFGAGEYMLHNLVNIGETPLSFVTVEHKIGANAPFDIGSSILSAVVRRQAMAQQDGSSGLLEVRRTV